jgi:hypothetical protein
VTEQHNDPEQDRDREDHDREDHDREGRAWEDSDSRRRGRRGGMEDRTVLVPRLTRRGENTHTTGTTGRSNRTRREAQATQSMRDGELAGDDPVKQSSTTRRRAQRFKEQDQTVIVDRQSGETFDPAEHEREPDSSGELARGQDLTALDSPEVRPSSDEVRSGDVVPKRTRAEPAPQTSRESRVFASGDPRPRSENRAAAPADAQRDPQRTNTLAKSRRFRRRALAAQVVTIVLGAGGLLYVLLTIVN